MAQMAVLLSLAVGSGGIEIRNTFPLVHSSALDQWTTNNQIFECAIQARTSVMDHRGAAVRSLGRHAMSRGRCKCGLLD